MQALSGAHEGEDFCGDGVAVRVRGDLVDKNSRFPRLRQVQVLQVPLPPPKRRPHAHLNALLPNLPNIILKARAQQNAQNFLVAETAFPVFFNDVDGGSTFVVFFR